LFPAPHITARPKQSLVSAGLPAGHGGVRVHRVQGRAGEVGPGEEEPAPVEEPVGQHALAVAVRGERVEQLQVVVLHLVMGGGQFRLGPLPEWRRVQGVTAQEPM
jgi:hypothetical protein